MTNRPTPSPLTKSERVALDDLIRRGAGALNSAERNRLLRLLELDRADRQQERRTAGGLERANRVLRQQLKDAEAEVQRQHADCQTAEAERDRLRALPAAIAYRIRAELVCCRVYDKVNDTGELTFEEYESKPGRHDLCYWGEAAARLAEDRADGAAAEELPS